MSIIDSVENLQAIYEYARKGNFFTSRACDRIVQIVHKTMGVEPNFFATIDDFYEFLRPMELVNIYSFIKDEVKYELNHNDEIDFNHKLALAEMLDIHSRIIFES